MEKSHLYVLLVLLLSVNIYSLFEFNSIDNELVKEKNESLLSDYRSNSYMISSKILANDEILTGILSDDISGDKTGYGYIVFATNKDCSNCIIDTTNGLEEIDTNLNDKLMFFYEETEEGFKYEDFFNYHNYRYTSKKFNHIKYFEKYDITQFPIFVVYNFDSKKVIEAYQPEPNNTILHRGFLNRLENKGIESISMK